MVVGLILRSPRGRALLREVVRGTIVVGLWWCIDKRRRYIGWRCVRSDTLIRWTILIAILLVTWRKVARWRIVVGWSCLLTIYVWAVHGSSILLCVRRMIFMLIICWRSLLVVPCHRRRPLIIVHIGGRSALSVQIYGRTWLIFWRMAVFDFGGSMAVGLRRMDWRRIWRRVGVLAGLCKRLGRLRTMWLLFQIIHVGWDGLLLDRLWGSSHSQRSQKCFCGILRRAGGFTWLWSPSIALCLNTRCPRSISNYWCTNSWSLHHFVFILFIHSLEAFDARSAIFLVARILVLDIASLLA